MSKGGEEWRKRGLILEEHQRYTAEQLRTGDEAVRILGGYFGSPEACEQAILEVVDNKLHINNRIFGLDGKHLQLVTLRLSCLPQLSFQLRTTPVAQVNRAAEEVDKWTTTALEAIMEVPRGSVRDHPTARDISQLPIRMGGVGLTSQVELAPYAYAASVGLAKVFCIKTASQRHEESPGAGVDDAALFQEMRRRGLPEVEMLTDVVEMTEDEYWDGDETQLYKGLQRKVMGILGIKKCNEVLYVLPSRGLQTILVDSASKVGRAWQQGVPYDGFLKLGDESVKLNLRLRLNVGMEEHNSPHLVNGQCKCIKSGDNKQTKVAHNYTCLLSSKIRNARHYAIRNVLFRAAKKGKMAPQLECPVELKDGATGRTDICLTEGMEAGIMHLDVVVAAPIQANTPSEPITREQVNEQAAKMKRAAVRRQKEAREKKQARQRAAAGSSSGVGSSHSSSSSSSSGASNSGVGGSRSSGASSSSGVGSSRSSSSNSSSGASSSGVGSSRSSSASSSGVGSSRSSSSISSRTGSSSSSGASSSSGVGSSRSSRNSSRAGSRSSSGAGSNRSNSSAGSNAAEREAAAHLSQTVADENSQDAGGDAVSGRDLMGDDGTSSALEAFKALHHPERKAAERLLITDCLRQAEKRKMRHYGHLINDSVGFMPVPFSVFGSTVPRVAKLLKGIAKRQKQEEVWDNLGRTTNLNPMATALQYSYANLSLLFARYHAKIIPWGHKTADFVALGFQDSDEDEDEDDHEWE